MTGVLIRRDDAITQRRPREDRGRDGAEAAPRYRAPGKLAASRSWKRDQNRLSLQKAPSAGACTDNTLTSDRGPQNCERTNFCCFRPPNLWEFVRGAVENQYRG